MEFCRAVENGSFTRTAEEMNHTLSDDYTILNMVDEGFGISAVYHLLLSNINTDLAVRSVAEHPGHTLALCYNNWEIMPKAARTFVKFIEENIDVLIASL